MPKVAPIQTSFSGGEFSPLLYGRVDSDRYREGLATCLNFLPTIQGGLNRRPGTRFVEETKIHSKKSRLIPFEFSTTQAYILEFGDKYIRFYMDNGRIVSSGTTPYEITSPYEEADLPYLRFTQSLDVLYLVHPDYPPQKLIRKGHSNWELREIDFTDGPYLSVNTDGVSTLVYASSSGQQLRSGPERVISTITSNAGTIRITTTAAHGYKTGMKVSITGTSMPEITNTWSWVIKVISTTVFDLVGSTYVDGTFSASSIRPTVFESTDVGRSVRVKIGTNWVSTKITSVTSGGIVNVEDSPVISGLTTATLFWRLGVWSDTTGYPGAVTFHEDRLVFAGNPSTPQRVDGSNSGDYENFAPSDATGTVVASNAVSFTLNSSDVNVIKWLVSDEKGLLAGSHGGEWVIKPASSNDALSPTNIIARRTTSYGSAEIAPVQVGKAVIFVQRAGRKVREFNYFYDVDGFRATDLTLLSEHITDSGTVEMAFQKEPQPMVWFVKSDGALIGMTYERDLDNLRVGWHRHTIGGVNAEVESVAVIPSPDGTRDELWMIVKRTINGSTKRYVEYLTKTFDDSIDQEDAFFVDSGLTYSGAAATTISGLTHLEGETVSILADGAVHPTRVVSSGAITLDYPSTKVHIGLGYNSDAQMLRIEAGAADGTALAKTRRIHRCGWLMHRSLNLLVGPSFSKLTRIIFRTSADAMNSAPSLFSGIKDETVEFDYDFENQICWRQDQPLPSTILAVMPKMVTYDR